MNKVYLSGIVSGPLMISSETEMGEHIEFDVQVRHKTSEGVIKKEMYRIHCWKRLCDWAKENLNPGKLVLIEGCLIQKSGVCVAAKEIILSEKKKKRYQSV